MGATWSQFLRNKLKLLKYLTMSDRVAQNTSGSILISKFFAEEFQLQVRIS